MSYKPYILCCTACGATCRSKGTEDSDTDSAEYEPDRDDWEGGDETCEHEDYECVSMDYGDDL